MIKVIWKINPGRVFRITFLGLETFIEISSVSGLILRPEEFSQGIYENAKSA
jgi:hypothetical protein